MFIRGKDYYSFLMLFPDNVTAKDGEHLRIESLKEFKLKELEEKLKEA